MRKLLRKTYNFLLQYGFDAKIFLNAIRTKKPNWFYSDLQELKTQKRYGWNFQIRFYVSYFKR